jgi:hypothetical protein
MSRVLIRSSGSDAKAESSADRAGVKRLEVSLFISFPHVRCGFTGADDPSHFVSGRFVYLGPCVNDE